MKRSDADPVAAVSDAKAWASSGGGVAAGQCLGIALSAEGDWTAAADTFTTTATMAGKLADEREATLWASAGNAALAAGDPDRARIALNSALDLTTMPPPLRGETFLDRARACVAVNDLGSARADINQALDLVGADPMAWLLSATLARRMGDLTRAAADILAAEQRAPADPDILFEGGNIAAAQGDMKAARGRWARARAADPNGDTGMRAEKELVATGGIPTPSAQPQGR